mmetsp:Transcript_44231/g.94250  ORF Transcript_44231/g.94250 Transcript_44231/m.94250 type:complete len:200 (+) Transcript_44231:1121-1720(+)
MVGRVEGLDHIEHEGVIILSENGTLVGHGRWKPAILCLHRLQGIAHLGSSVLHQAHHTGGACADDAHTSEIRQGDLGVLKADAVHEVLGQVPMNDVPECLLVYGPQLGRVAGDLHSGSSPLVEEEGALAKASVAPLGANEAAVDGHRHLAVGDHEEGVAWLALDDDAGAAGVTLRLQRRDNLLGLLLGKVAEDGYLLHH